MVKKKKSGFFTDLLKAGKKANKALGKFQTQSRKKADKKAARALTLAKRENQLLAQRVKKAQLETKLTRAKVTQEGLKPMKPKRDPFALDFSDPLDLL